MPKIVINIDMEELKSGINQVVDDDIEAFEFEEEEVAFVCPLSTQDPDLNEENRKAAVKENFYGPAVGNWESKNQKCGNCEYYNIKSAMMGCIRDGLGMDEDAKVGYCEELDFTCAADNVCNEWEKGGPISDFDDVREGPIEGNERDIF